MIPLFLNYSTGKIEARNGMTISFGFDAANSGTQTVTGTIDASGGALKLPAAAAPAQTAEGSVVWDSDDDVLTVGDGSSRKTMCDTATAQTLTNKTLTAPTITAPAITGAGTIATGTSFKWNAQTVAAAGSAQGDAGAVTALRPAVVHVTGADATKGAVLPAAALGDVVMLKNADAANAILKVYPATGEQINALGANAAISMAAKTASVFFCVVAGQWYTLPLLPS